MELPENALKVLEARYLPKNEEGTVVETPEEMFRRVAALRHIRALRGVIDAAMAG
jgi:ribonucleotide reductase alpha subunit